MKHAAVIGAGVIGVSCAYFLAKAGWRVTLVDKGLVGGGCSHGNCGYVSPSHVLPHAGPGAIANTLKNLFQRNSALKIRPKAVLSNLGWFRGFARRCNEKDQHAAAEGITAILKSSRRLYDELLQSEKFDVEWDTNGLLFLFQTAAGFEHYRHVNELLSAKFATPATEISKDKLLDMEPSLKPEAVSGAFHYRSDAQLRPDVLMRVWRNRVEELGVMVLENCEFDYFEDRNAVVTSAWFARPASGGMETIDADAFVVATGAWTPLLNDQLGAKIPIIPGKGYSITMPRPSLCPKYPLIFEEHHVAVSPFQTGYRIGSTMEFAGYDATLNRNRIQLLKDAARIYLKEPFAEPVKEEWWGWRPMVYDGKPIIGPSPTFKNVFVAVGHGMLGLSMATGTGKLVAELVTGDAPHIEPSHYSLTRFRS